MVRPPISIEELRDLVRRGGPRSLSGYELVAGVPLVVALPDPAVVTLVTELADVLDRALPDHRVAVREAVAVGDHDLLRPEVTVVRPVWGPTGVARLERAAHDSGYLPASAVALLVFVGAAEAPLRWRAHRCARPGIPEVWTVAIDEASASRWCRPHAGRYERRDALLPDEPVSLDAAPGTRVVAWPSPRVA